MNAILRTASLAATFAATAMAGGINVVQLGPPDVIRFEVACGGVSQGFDLAHGGTTGGFILPEKEGTITLPNHEIPSLTIPATASSNIAVLAPAEKGYRWKLIPGKPTDGKWGLRVVNLSAETAKLAQDGAPLELAPDSTTEIPVEGIAGVTVQIGATAKGTYRAEEPCAVLALIYRKAGEWEILFVPDR